MTITRISVKFLFLLSIQFSFFSYQSWTFPLDSTLMITCPPDTIITCFADVSISVLGSATAIDQCISDPVINFSDEYIDGDCYSTIGILRTWTASDQCGNTAECVQIIQEIDSVSPVITCPPDVTVNCNFREFDPYGVDLGFAEVWDECDNFEAFANFEDVNVPGDCGQDTTIYRTWTAIDGCGNSSECTQIISVEDPPPFFIFFPNDMILSCEEYLEDPYDLNPSNIYPIPADWCNEGGGFISYEDEYLEGACPQEKVVRRTWTVTDDCNQSSQEVQLITIIDFTPPIIDCPNNITVSCAIESHPSITGITTAIDACGGATQINYLDEFLNDPQEPLNEIRRIWSATDECGNISNCVQTITIDDSLQPIDLLSEQDTLFICHQESFLTVNAVGEFNWQIASADSSWQMLGDIDQDTLRFVSGTHATSAQITLNIIDPFFGCTREYTQIISCQDVPFIGEACTLTRDSYGDINSRFCDTVRTAGLIADLLTDALILGRPGNSITFTQQDASCIVALLPGGGSPQALSGGDISFRRCYIQGGHLPLSRQGELQNTLLSEAIVLKLNTRLSPSLLNLRFHHRFFRTISSNRCLYEHSEGEGIYSIPSSLVGRSVRELMDLVNRALYGENLGISLDHLTSAMQTINMAFEQCRTFSNLTENQNRQSLNEDFQSRDHTSSLFRLSQSPTSSNIHLDIMPIHPGKFQLIFTDIHGRQLLKKELFLYEGLNSHHTSIERLAKGVYNIQLIGQKELFTERFIKN